MNKKFTYFACLVGAIALVGVSAPAASAAESGETVTVFALEGGTLDIAVQKEAQLNSDRSGATSITGNLGQTDVSDTRGVTLGWATSAATTEFTGDTGTTSTAVAYDAGEVRASGSVGLKNLGAVDLGEKPAPVLYGVDAVGNNGASWNPTLTVALPSDSLAGTYRGVITTSVV